MLPECCARHAAFGASHAACFESTARLGVKFGNLRDTVATRVAGKTGDARRASTQPGRMDGVGIATRHYLDPAGFVHVVVDNADILKSLMPVKVGV